MAIRYAQPPEKEGGRPAPASANETARNLQKQLLTNYSSSS